MYFLISLDLKICLFSDIFLPRTPKNPKKIQIPPGRRGLEAGPQKNAGAGKWKQNQE